ncbi:MAG: hypothetical protein HY908_14720, partial [Myxococcales bacterium]|nr:hypothetical protein [Myxococcales bacterium]
MHPRPRLASAGLAGVAPILVAWAATGCGSSVESAGSGGGGASATTTTTTTATGGAGGSAGAGGGGTTSSTGGSGGTPDPWEPLQALKEVDLGVVDFQEGPYLVPIPDRTLGFTLLAEATALDKGIGVYRLKPPAGSSVIVNFAMAGHSTQVFGDMGWVSAADPQTTTSDAWPVQPGLWTYDVAGDTTQGTAHVRVYARRTLDGLFHGGVLDVNVFIPPGTVSQSYMQGVIESHLFPDYFSPAIGLAQGALQFFAAPSSATSIGNYDELRTLFASVSAGASAPALNLVVVGDFSDAEFGGAIGVAAGIPGSPMRHGTTRSGVAYQPSGDQAYDASILGHEVSHLAGLFHTTEFQIVETDPLFDTPTCDPAVIQSNPQACPDLQNIMFPIAYGGQQFSAAQITVFQGSAMYRGVLEAGGAPAAPLFASEPGDLPPAFAPDPRFDLLATDAPARAPADELERLFGAGPCAHAPGVLALFDAEAAAAGGTRLIALARDAGAADRVRARALEAYGRL